MISIVIPVYNVEHFLEKCLDSILDNNGSGFEVICVNDGSTDGSLSILEQYARRDERIKIINQSNQGLSAARNAGLNAASGEYVLFLDSDDWLESDALRLLAPNLNGEDLVCFNGRRFLEDKEVYEEPDTLIPESGITGWDYYCKHALEHRNFAFVCVVLRCYRREYLLKNNLFFKPGIFHEDNLFTPLACYYAKSVKVILDVLYNYRVRSSSIMTTRSLKHWQDIITTANELAEFFIEKSDIENTTIYRALTHYYQSAFQNVSHKEDKQLYTLVDWKWYWTVSRTKPRHKIQYVAMRLNPVLFRCINRVL